MSRRRYKFAPVPFRDLVAAVLRERGLARPGEHRAVFAAWEKIVPEGMRARCRPLSFRNGSLLVAVSSAPLLAELRGFRSGEFLGLLNRELAHAAEHAHLLVRRVDFRRA